MSEAGAELLTRFAAIRAKVDAATRAAGREPASVGLVAVSKIHPYEKIRALYEAGHRDFGENYVQELVEKANRAKVDGLTEIRWHFIGHLQSNKVKMLVPHVFMIHGIGSLRLAEEVSKRAENRRIPALIEVNVDDQESKSGVQISELRPLIEGATRLPGIEIQGLMCIPDPERPNGASEAFRRLAALAADHGLRVLSMGMTADFVDAIAAGSTLVRIGTAIFGERSPREKL